MPPRGNTPALRNPIKLPPLRHLKVRQPSKTQQDPCIGVMNSMLGCWASAGPARAAQQCVMLEQQLRACMDNRSSQAKKSTPINRQLNRLYPQIVGPRKR